MNKSVVANVFFPSGQSTSSATQSVQPSASCSSWSCPSLASSSAAVECAASAEPDLRPTSLSAGPASGAPTAPCCSF